MDRHADEALERLLSGRLPIPTRERFQPLRLGLIGIWEYEEQEFFFHDGRLILRGRNGSGKTKVLEVSSPFLLDGVLATRRLDPFGHAARSMRENLLYRGRRHRIGYVWFEYGRVGHGGENQYLTIGAGLRAQAAKPGTPESWFLVTPQRPGRDFSFYDERRTPYGQKALREVLGNDAVVETAKEYRAKVARELFGFSPSQLRSLVELLLTLRRPKLSEDFDVEKLQELLRDGLPPVNGTLLDELAGRFDELAREREELESLQQTQRNVNEFLTTYQTFARRVVRNAAEDAVRVSVLLGVASDTVNAAGKRLEECKKTTVRLRNEESRLKEELSRAQARLVELEGKPELAEHGRLEDLGKQITAALKRTEEAKGEAERAKTDYDTNRKQQSDLEQQLGHLLSMLETAEHQSYDLAAKTMLSEAHRSEGTSIREDPEAAEVRLTGQVDARIRAVEGALPLVDKVDTADKELDLVKQFHENVEARWNQAKDNVDQSEEEHQRRIEELCTRITEWSSRCSELRLTEDQLIAVIRVARAAGEPDSPSARAVVADLAEPFAIALAEEYAALRADRENARAAREALTARQEQVAFGPAPEPESPSIPRRDRTAADDGAPFWAVVDFLPHVESALAGRIEAALSGAGILDSWVTANGKLLVEGRELDAFLAGTEASPAQDTLADVLCTVQHPRVNTEHVHRLLTSIGYSHGPIAEGVGAGISSDGAWRIGPISGRTTGEHASFIGPAARAAERQRRLDAIDYELDQLDEAIRQQSSMIAKSEKRASTLTGERSSPNLSDAAVRETFTTRATAHLLLSELDSELNEAGRKVSDQISNVNFAKAALETYARERHIPTTPDAVRAEQKALTRYRESILGLFRAVTLWRNVGTSFEHAKAQTVRSVEGRDHLLEIYERLDGEQRALIEIYDQRSSLIGADVTAVLTAIQKSRKVIAEAQPKLGDTQKKIVEEAKNEGGQAQALGNARDRHEERSKELTASVGAYLALCRQGLVSLAVGEEFVPDDPSAATESARMAAHFLAAEEWHEKARNQARNDVDKQFRLLEIALSGPDWQPRAENDGGVVVVRLVHNGQPVDIPAALERIRAEISTRKSYLNDEERELFKKVLLGQVGEHLRRRRVEAVRLIERMNALLKTRRTAAGMRLELVWEPDPDQSPEVRAALETLDRQATKFLPDQARDQLIHFLVGLVEAARDRQDVVDWKASLREALDYRAWSRIRIRYQPAGDQPWTDLTNEKHQKGSGGEKAVSLQLPLFVAAAAHYAGAAPTAPRPVYLDEAFAGIDRPMRGECMGLLTDLDLDVVMASHDEFGFHPEVPGVATYELFRDSEVEGVLTTPILWDGSQRHELPDPALIQDTSSSDGTLWEDDDDWEEPSDDDEPET